MKTRGRLRAVAKRIKNSGGGRCVVSHLPTTFQSLINIFFCKIVGEGRWEGARFFPDIGNVFGHVVISPDIHSTKIFPDILSFKFAGSATRIEHIDF